MKRLRIECAGVLTVLLALMVPLLVFLYGAAVFGVLPLVLIGLMVLAGEPIHQLRQAMLDRRRA